MNVPFLDLKVQYESIRADIDEAIQAVVASTAFAGGPFVQRFEEEFARYCGCAHAVGVGSGTEALCLALAASGVGVDDEVITVPNSFIATAEAISWCGAKPVFVDVVPDTYTLNPVLLDEAISSRTKAIVPVHLYGQAADMDPIREIGRRHGVTVIEDACQAHGALYKGHRAGSMGEAAAFSFYPGKNLGAYGEGGAVVTNNPELATQVRLMRDHGQSSKYHHELVGRNARMDGIQAAVLSVKLRHLDDWNASRRRSAELYRTRLGLVVQVIVPTEAEYARHVYHVYAIRVRNRDALAGHLRANGVGVGIHYPIPIHLQPAYRNLAIREGSFPVTETSSRELLSLPMFAELREDQIGRVTELVRGFFASNGGAESKSA
jgi:dTDP-4-amino-4,6-dideoxygalactose transaminase